VRPTSTRHSGLRHVRDGRRPLVRRRPRQRERHLQALDRGRRCRAAHGRGRLQGPHRRRAAAPGHGRPVRVHQQGLPILNKDSIAGATSSSSAASRTTPSTGPFPSPLTKLHHLDLAGNNNLNGTGMPSGLSSPPPAPESRGSGGRIRLRAGGFEDPIQSPANGNRIGAEQMHAAERPICWTGDENVYTNNISSDKVTVQRWKIWGRGRRSRRGGTTIREGE
jgi:hypothetical protein